MAGIIKLLPESTANQIAAGEVVQRPASVVKELLENALDAGASEIKLFVQNGGSTYIQVDDNGCGMNAFDARMCWERHATSKISKAEDLYALGTLGFRGEALASIASVSEVEMKTKSAEENVGTLIKISAGKLLTQENCAATQGTSIKVKNLFFNLPARKNFLKSITVETKHIFTEFQRVALSYPNVAFEYYNQEKRVLSLAAGSLKQRIQELLSIKDDELIKTEEQTDIVGINGFLASPKQAKRTRGNQFLFANGRYIKDAYLNHAISSAYGQLLEEKQYPTYVLFLEVEPDKIDVNIHPTKHEVKFQDGRHVYTLLNSVVKKSLSDFYTLPTDQQLTFPSSFSPDTERSSSTNPFRSSKPSGFNPFGEQAKPRTKTEWEKWDDLMQTPVPTQPTHTPSPQPSELLQSTSQESFTLFQVNEAYVVANVKGELWLINQHRAHTQILFEKYRNQQSNASQQLLFPRTIEFSSADYQLILELKDKISALGFDLDEFGKNTIIINGLPVELAKEDGAEVLQNIIDEFKVNDQELSLEKNTSLRMAAAKYAAIKAGKVLSVDEMQQLVADLLQCNEKYHDFNGKPIVVKLTKSTLERYFQ